MLIITEIYCKTEISLSTVEPNHVLTHMNGTVLTAKTGPAGDLV